MTVSSRRAWPDAEVQPLSSRCPGCADRVARIEQLEATVDDLHRKCSHDHLTGVVNRLIFEDSASRELSRAGQYGEAVSLVFCDVDRFKLVNDRFGHHRGDEVLRGVASSLSEVSRGSDVVARFGGEEFVVLLPNTGSQGARLFAERARETVARPQYPGVGAVTASFGVAQALHRETLGDWLRRADEAMYEAKRQGRNRVIVAPGEAGQTESSATGFLQLVWRECYECGNDTIDRQHKALFAAGGELLQTATAGQRADTLLLLQALISEAVLHFADEERILQESAFPGLVAHVRAHRALADKAAQLYEECVSGVDNLGLIVSFLTRTLIAGHMLREDRKFFHLVHRGTQPPSAPPDEGQVTA